MRYFDRDDIERFFTGWQNMTAERGQMGRYGKPREIWKVLCTK